MIAKSCHHCRANTNFVFRNLKKTRLLDWYGKFNIPKILTCYLVAIVVDVFVNLVLPRGQKTIS